MDHKDAMRHLQQNPQMIESIMRSRDGQALMQLLQSDGGGAMQQAQNGDVSQVAQMLRSVMSDPNGKALLERLSRELQI